MIQVTTFKQEMTDREVGEIQRNWNPKHGTLKFKKISESGMYHCWYVPAKKNNRRVLCK